MCYNKNGDNMDDINSMFGHFLLFVFVFFLGSMVGWLIELVFRRIFHKKFVNPGFLVGPYLPIYGFGLCIITFIHVFFEDYNLNEFVQIILMGLCMTLLELIGGLIFLKQGVRLWDYRDRKFNYKGVICPTFTIIWTAVGAFYNFFLASHVLDAINWFTNNSLFSYFLGLFTGVITIDFLYSTRLYKKIKKFAKNNSVDIMYEKLKLSIKEFQDNTKEKYSFIMPFKQTRSLLDYLSDYIDKNQNKGNK